mgnify:CR=1 FL=1
MYDQIKRKYKTKFSNYVSSFGYKISKIEKSKFEIYKINKIKDPKKRINLQKEFVKNYPELPLAHYEYAKSLWLLRDPNFFDQLSKYAMVQEKWLENSIFNFCSY